MTDGASARWRDSVSGWITGGHDTIRDPGSKDPGVLKGPGFEDPGFRELRIRELRIRGLSHVFLVKVGEEGEECCIVSVRGGT